MPNPTATPTNQDVLDVAKVVLGKVQAYVEKKIRASEVQGVAASSKMISHELKRRHKKLVADITMDLVSAIDSRVDAEVEARIGKHLHPLQLECASLHAAYESLQNMIRSLPIPQVNVSVPENAIKMMPSHVQVNVPHEAIQVNVPNVIIPEKSINVQVAPAEVTVALPQRITKVEKSILYDPQSGRPARIVEETTEN